MSQHILEVVTFAAVAGTGEHEFLTAAETASSALQSLPGFIRRRVAKAEDGRWLDVVEWANADSAAGAAKVFHTMPEAQPFCAMVDMASAKMTHYQVVVVSN
jgi:hypothetical protein